MSQFLIDTIAVIIGLGNPGPKYHFTRHNIGFLFLDYLANSSGASWRSSGQALISTVRLNNKELLLIKPQTFMNSSGVVWSLIAKKGIRPEQVLVAHDELEKKFNTFQIRLGGSARGHNGLRSLIAAAGENFWRLRLGVDRPEDKNTVPEYVLTSFPVEQKELLANLFMQVLQSW
jgi:PTH1 family peptidyl-tRNA hydrolase